MYQESKLNENINNENINDVVDYLENIFGSEYDVTFEEEDDKFNIYIDNQILIPEIDSSYKVGDIIVSINTSLGVNNYQGETSALNNEHQSRPRRNNPYEKISIRLNKVYQAVLKIEEANKALADYQAYTNHTYITGELNRAYSQMGDNTSELLLSLSSFINSLHQTVYNSLVLYNNVEQKNYQDLQDLINELFSNHQEFTRFVDREVLGDDTINYEEFSEFIDGTDTFYNEMYQNILNNFKNSLVISHTLFLRDTVPEVLNIAFEDAYAKAMGREDTQGLVKFKEDFGKKVLSLFNEKDIKEFGEDDKLQKASNYEKALLMLSYSEDFTEDRSKEILSLFNETLPDDVKLHPGNLSQDFAFIETHNNLFKMDFENKSLKEVMSEFENYVQAGKYSYDNLLAYVPTNPDERSQILDENGGIDLLKLREYRINNALPIINNRNDLTPSFDSTLEYSLLSQSLLTSFNTLSEEKLKLDASKANFKLGMLQALNTSDVKEKSINYVKDMLKKFLEMILNIWMIGKLRQQLKFIKVVVVMQLKSI